jgi:hypothetical protein
VIDPRWAILAGLVALGASGGWFARNVLADRAMARVEADMVAQREEAAAAAVKASEAARAEERRRSARHQEVTRDALQQADAARRDAADAHGAAEQLRQSILQQVSSGTGNGSRCDSATPRGGEAAAAAGLVLADVCGRSGARAAELAAALDAARGAGLACERAYDALIGR